METCADLRDVSHEFWEKWNGYTEMLPEAHRFARSYFEAPDEQFAERITPNYAVRAVDGILHTGGVESLTVSIDGTRSQARARLDIMLGRGAEPAVIVNPEIYKAVDRSANRQPTEFGKIARALTECEGRGMVLDVQAAIRHTTARRRRFWQSLGLAKVSLLG